MNKKAAIVLLSIVLGVGLFPVTALADPVEESGGQITGVIEQESAEEAGNESESAPEGTQEQGDPAGNETATPAQESEEAAPSGIALTPGGNLTLVDDYSGADTAGKQFITLSTRSGNIFYLIIDRDDEGNETVHFLNQVDEEDLLRLMDEEEADAIREQLAAQKVTPTPKPTVIVKQPTETPKPAEKKPVNVLPLLAPLLLVLGGGGAFAFYSFRKKKKAETVTVDPDADYQEEEYDFSEAFEDEEEDPENDGYDDDDEM